jgi:hypothetical protein
LNDKRRTALLVSVGGGVRLPVMEGDRIEVIERETVPGYLWKPRFADGEKPDIARMKKGERGERVLHGKFFKKLYEGGYLLSEGEREYRVEVKPEVEKAAPEKIPELPVRQEAAVTVREKRRPLLRLPVWGLPPRWH